MSRVDLAELRRLHEAANKPEGWTAIEHGNFARAAFNALPALLDELEAAREEVAALCTEHNATVDERDQLRAELEKLRCELDDAEERASEAEERCAAEWEKDCGQALRLLAQVTKFEWDQDGSPADEVREHIQITIESLDKQVLALRAELAAAREEADSATRNWKLTQERATRWAKESTALAADNARLRKALELAPMYIDMVLVDKKDWLDLENKLAITSDAEQVRSALAATPAQFLAAHDAALLREVWKKVCVVAVQIEERESRSFTWTDAATLIHDEAERIEKEAANGKA